MAAPSPSSPPTFRVWVRKTAVDGTACAVRFQVDHGKAVMRVLRPGVLIVPPARDHGHEDHLSPGQLRSSVFLHVPGPGQPREAYALDRITDLALQRLDVDVWVELTPVRGPTRDDHRLELREDEQVISLAGEVTDPEDLTTLTFADDVLAVAEIGQIVERVTAVVRDPDEAHEDTIEADSEAPRHHAHELPTQPGQAPATGTPPLRRPPPRVESVPPPVHGLSPLSPAEPQAISRPRGAGPASPPASAPPAAAGIAPPDAPSISPPKLARHHRRQLERKDLALRELEARLRRLEHRLRELGVDPDAL